MKRNLFHIDLVVIEATLEEANSRLSRSVDAYVARAKTILADPTTTDSKLEEARRWLAEKSKEVRLARLEDGRPFRSATKLIESWFEPLEQSLKSTESAILNEANRRLRDLRASSPDDPLAISPTAIATASNGRVVGSIAADETTETAAGAVWTTQVSVVGVERDRLDLNELRDHFTERELVAAAKRLLKANPAIRLRGVKYEDQVL